MLDLEYVKWFATLGVGGILAAFMFVFYRKDVKAFTELWKAQTEMLVTVIKDNTASNVRLIGLIEAMERNTARKNDLLIEMRDRRKQELDDAD